MRFCPECKTQYDSGEVRCPNDEAPLLTLPEQDAPPLERSGLQRLQPVEADNSRYTIISKIGQGGWGGIYRAYQHSTRREVALKVLRQEVAHDDIVRRRFHREAEAVSRLKHPNTVTTFDFGETPDGLLFIAMEFIDGISLDKVIESEGKLPPARAVNIARQIALSLAEAHEKGIVHRDVKPHNIMLTSFDGSESFVKVLDFGVAKLMAVESNLTTTGATFGTPEYMSPEQVQSKDIDQRSDLYALGIILYQMLAGAPPFSGNSAVTVALSHVRQRPPAIRDRSDVPRPLLGLVKRLLAKDPRDRPQSARELAGDLEAIEARLVVPAGGDTSRMFRNMAVAMTSSWHIVVAVVVLVAVVTAVVAALRSQLPRGTWSFAPDITGEVLPTRPALSLVVSDVPTRRAADVVAGEIREANDIASEGDSDLWIADVNVARVGADDSLAEATDGGHRVMEVVAGSADGVAERVDSRVGVIPDVLREPGPVDVRTPRPDVTSSPAPVVQEITANVEGADVTVDGVTLCETPCKLEGRAGEKRKIRVLKRGFITARRRFTFAPGAEPLYIELKKVSLSQEDGLKGAPTPAEKDGLK